MSLEVLGWIGSIAFAICGAPQAYMSYKQGHSDGISLGFLFLWYMGEVCTLAYIIPKADLPLIFNYLSNLVFVSVVFKYKLFPRRTNE